MSLCGSAAPNCTPYWEGKDFRRYEADPDIAGIGVQLRPSSLESEKGTLTSHRSYLHLSLAAS